MATRRKPLKAAQGGAILYIRVSTEKQVESGLGLADQREKLAAYCAMRGLEVAEIVTDEGESAFRELHKRPGGRRILEAVRKRGVSAVVVLKLDRAFRNTVDALQTAEILEKAGVSLHIVDFGGQAVDTSSAMGRMMLTMFAAMAEFERNLAAERTTAALAAKVRGGSMRIGACAPYGWRFEGEALAEVPHEQAVIAAMRKARAEGLSLRATGAELRRLGFKNRAGGDFAPVQIQNMELGSVRQLHAADNRP